VIFTIVGILAILLLGVVGWMRGALRILSSFAALLVAGFLAGPLKILTEWIFTVTHWLPLSLVPLGGMLLTGLLLFIVFESWAAWYLKRREKARQAQELAPRTDVESWTGAILGAAWGVCLVSLVLIGIDLIAVADLAVAKAASPHPPKAKVAFSNPYDRPLPTPMPTPVLDDTDKKLEAMQKDIQDSIFGGIVHQASPLDDAGRQTLDDLTLVLGDPVLFDKFQQLAPVKTLAQDPKLVALSQDPQVARWVRSQDYGHLLDDSKIADMLNDPDIYRKCRDLHVGVLLKQIEAQP
jgi:hypothetical protein